MEPFVRSHVERQHIRIASNCATFVPCRVIPCASAMYREQHKSDQEWRSPFFGHYNAPFSTGRYAAIASGDRSGTAVRFESAGVEVVEVRCTVRQPWRVSVANSSPGIMIK